MNAFLVTSSVDGGMSPGSAGVLASVANVIAFAAMFGAGSLVDREHESCLFGHRRIVRVCRRRILVAQFGGRALSIAGAVLVYAAGWAWTGLFQFSVVLSHSHAPASASGVTETGLAVGAAAGPLLFGLVAAEISYRVAWGGAAASVAIAASVILLAGWRLTLRGLPRLRLTALLGAGCEALRTIEGDPLVGYVRPSPTGSRRRVPDPRSTGTSVRRNGGLRGVICAGPTEDGPSRAADRGGVEAATLNRLYADLLEQHETLAVFAVAGFLGKTVQAQLFASEERWALAWLTLSHGDRSTSRMLSYLAATLERHVPAAPQVLEAAFKDTSTPEEAAAILAESVDVPSLLLVIDHCESIADAYVSCAALETFLDYLPPGVRTMLLSRSELQFSLGRLLLQGRAGRIMGSDLALTFEEAEKGGPLPHEVTVLPTCVSGGRRHGGGWRAWPSAVRTGREVTTVYGTSPPISRPR